MNQEEAGLSNVTIVFMIVVALIYDVVQIGIQLAPIVGQILATLINFFAYLTFLLWFGIHGIRFFRPKRLLALGGGFLLEVFSLGILPGLTVSVATVALDSKIKKIVPGLDIIKK